MRIGGIFVDGHVGAVLPLKSRAAHCLLQPLNQVELGERTRSAAVRWPQMPCDLAESFGEDLIDQHLRFVVRANLLFRINWRPSYNSPLDEYKPFSPGSVSRRPCSTRCTSLRGSPSAGMK